MSDKTICNLPELVGGPFKQVLYLGCSVKDFKINMGWGGENSSCTINLVRDTSDFPATTFSPPSNYSDYQETNSQVFKQNHLNNPRVDTKKTLFRDVEYSPEIYKDDNRLRKKDNYTGKVCYSTRYPTSLRDARYLTKADPGFLADKKNNIFLNPQQGHNFDIIGVASIFKWEDIFFGGIIQNYTKKDDGSYSVELNSFAKALKGVTLILKEYYGSISTKVGDKYLPFNWAFFPDTDYDTAWPQRGKGGADWQGYGNVFNIFGYLESQGFGNSGYSRTKGIPARKVYNALKDIMGYITPATPNYQQILFRRNSPFSPTQGIVTKHLFSKETFTRRTPSEVLYEGISLENFGIPDGNVFLVDFSNIPEPPDGVYISSDTMDLISFIDFCCDGSGLDYYIYFDGVIRVDTIDRKQFKYRNDLNYYVESLTDNDAVINYQLGEEYSQNNTTKIVVGGNQKRLLQVNSMAIGTPYFKVYDPNTDSFYLNWSPTQAEIYTQPNYLNWYGGDSGFYGDVDRDKIIAGHSYSWSPHPFTDTDTSRYRRDKTKGSYFGSVQLTSSTNLGLNNISPFFGIGRDGNFRGTYWDNKTGQMSLKMNWSDLEPFLPGLYDNTYTSATLNSWVKTNFLGQHGYDDYDPLTYGAGDFLVSENELRAAGVSYDSWWDYTQTRAALGVPTDLARILYNYIYKNYDPALAEAILYTDIAYDKPRLDYMAYLQIASNMYGGKPLTLGPVTHEQYKSYASGFTEILKNIYSFFASLVQQHYGKTYAIRLPNVITGYEADIGAKPSYVITDSAWENEGNMIDDTMYVGSVAASKLREEDGRIGMILGYDNSATTVSRGGPTIDYPTPTNAPSFWAIQYQIALKAGYIGGTTYWPLVHNLPNDQVVMLPYGTYGCPTCNITSELDSENKKWRLYTKASVSLSNAKNQNNPNIIYDGNIAKVIVSAPGEIMSLADTSKATVFDEIWTMLEKGVTRTPTTDTIADQNFNILPAVYRVTPNMRNYLKFMLWQNSRVGIIETIQSEDPYMLNRAPLPTFAAVPIESQYYRYGPWVNDPFNNVIKPRIITDTNDVEQQNNILGNLAGSTTVEINDSLVPWEYGGESAMSIVGANSAGYGNQYQTNLEVGSITFAGMVLRGSNVGDRLANDQASAIITSISISMDPSNGITTTYQFRTASRKLGLFNKELSDTYKHFNQQNLKNGLKILQSNAANTNFAGIISDRENESILSKFQKGLAAPFALNPTVTSFGKSTPLYTNLNVPSNFVMVANNFSAQDRDNFEGNSWNNPDNISGAVGNVVKSTSYISIIPDNQAFKFLGPNYDKVSMMSFDGLFSPISLYPTVNNSTFNVTKYTRSQCPYCRGQQYVNIHKDLHHFTLDGTLPSSIKDTDANNAAFKKNKTYPANLCPFCMPDIEKSKDIKQHATRNLMDPPYILVSGTDLYLENRAQEYRDNPLSINKYSLTPFVLNSGDFGCSLGRQNGDLSAYNVDIAAFGHLPPETGLSARGQLSSIPGFNGEAFDKALMSKNGNVKAQNNIRFIGLRGPLMVHGWGYDLNGYPVPNSSGEFKRNANGTIIQHNGVNLYKNQTVQQDGTVTAPYPEHTFYKGWADSPSSWPVGPIDLRWDSLAGVWTTPQGYKKVWVTIENDLVDENPVRGSIESMGESTDVLPDNYRRVVYVRNPLGTTKAPRWSSLYCEYSPDNSQYIPLTNNAIFATGTIVSSDTANIYTDYAYVKDPTQAVQTYNAMFLNPLQIPPVINSVGFFVFGGPGKWILHNIGE